MNWSELNHELLRVIAKKVRDISDFIRLRTVCKRWRSVVDLSDMAPQSPCSVKYSYSCKSSTCTSFDIQFRYHENFSQRIHIVPVNNIPVELGEVTSMCASLSGFLLLHYSKNPKPWLLVNPLTGFHSLLPFEKECTYASPIYFGHSCRPKTNQLVKNDIDAVFTENLFSGGHQISLWRYDDIDMEWRMMARVPITCKEHATYCNNGRLCLIVRETGHIRVVDINTGKVTVILDSNPHIISAYLLEEGGDLLCVFYNLHKHQIEVHLLEDFDTNPRLKKLKSIGNRVIFTNTIFNALCLKASDCEGYRSNSIYSNVAYWRYDIETNKTESRACLDNSIRWFIPSLF